MMALHSNQRSTAQHVVALLTNTLFPTPQGGFHD